MLTDTLVNLVYVNESSVLLVFGMRLALQMELWQQNNQPIVKIQHYSTVVELFYFCCLLQSFDYRCWFVFLDSKNVIVGKRRGMY